ncbi:MAG: M48 family metallopeptidase [Armatimonadota bacterium]
MNSHLHIRHLMIFIIVSIIILPVLSGCAPKSLVSTSQEVEIGREASRDIESQYRLVTDSQLNARVNQIGQAIAKCSDRPDLQYTFKILDLKDVNAVSLPGGWVYVYRGLIDETRNNPDQLAGVIAHEVGHIAARHHADMIGRETYASILVGTLTKGDVTQIAGIFANLTLLRWSRKNEYESDRLGIKYMYRCRQYDPQGLVNFFNTLLSMEKNQPSEFQQIFRTHPVTTDRIERAQNYLNDLKAGREKP